MSNISNFCCSLKSLRTLSLSSIFISANCSKKPHFFSFTKLCWCAHKAIDYIVRDLLTTNDQIVESQNHRLSQVGRDLQGLSKSSSWPGTRQPQESYWLLVLSLYLKMLCKLFIWKVLLKFNSKNFTIFIYCYT